VPTLRIRPAEPSDIEPIVHLVNRAFVAESPWIEGERIDLDGLHELWARGKFLVAEDNGLLTACVFIEPRGERAHLGLVSVDPTRQGTGLGSQLMAAVEAHCREAGFREMELRFINHRTELEHFYKGLGFSPSGLTEPAGAHRIKAPFHFVQMIKALD